MSWPGIMSSDGVTGQTVSSISRSGTTATVTVTGHGYSNGDSVFLLSGSPTVHPADNPYSGAYTVANAAADTFDITVSSSLPSSGNVSSMLAYVGYPTGSIATGSWQIHGNWCKFNARLVLDTGSLNAAITGNLRWIGLPYRALTSAGQQRGGLDLYYCANLNGYALSGLIQPNGFQMLIRKMPMAAAAAAFASIPVTDLVINANTTVFVSGAYLIG